MKQRVARLRRVGTWIAALCWTSTLGCGTWLERLVPPPDPPAPALPAASRHELDRGTLARFGVAQMQREDAIVRVVADGFSCTGTLVGPSEVLTAHHCVTERNEAGEFRPVDLPPAAIRVELGGDHMPWAEVSVREVVAPPCGHAGGAGDVAVLVLARPLKNVPILRVRLDEPPRPGELITPVGFGRCANAEHGVQRRERTGGQLDPLDATRVLVSASICPGDSGGPALDGDGRIVGVVSASAMDGREETVDRTELTRMDAWRSVFASARLVARGTALAELPPVDGCPGNVAPRHP